jgi:hypothetical protein
MVAKVMLRWAIPSLLFFSWIGCGEKAIKLRLEFNEGDEYKYNLIQDSTTTTEFMGKKMEMPNKTEITLTQRVEKVEQGVAELSITYDSYDMEMNVGGKKIPSTMGKKMIGETSTMKLRENGEIIEPEGIQGMVGFQGLGSDIRNIFFAIYPWFPERKLKVGERWTQTKEISQSPMKVAIDAQYTLSKLEAKKGYDCAVIDYTISMSFETGDQAKMHIKGKGEGKGTTFFAYEKGFLVMSQVEMDLAVSISAPLPTGKQEIPTSTHQTITLSLI